MWWRAYIEVVHSLLAFSRSAESAGRYLRYSRRVTGGTTTSSVCACVCMCVHACERVCACVCVCASVILVSSHNSIMHSITTPSGGTTCPKPEPTHCCPQLYGAHVNDVPTKTRSRVKLAANMHYFSRSCSGLSAGPPTECHAHKGMLPANSSADTLPLPFVQTDTTHLYVAAHTHTLMWTRTHACTHMESSFHYVPYVCTL